MPGIEDRRYIRTKLRANIKLCHPDVGELLLQTADISDGGVYITTDEDQPLEEGAVVTVQVQGMGGDAAPVMSMRIVRMNNHGIGLEFVTEDAQQDESRDSGG